MFELITSGGWLMIPIMACSVASLAIILERFWALQDRLVSPLDLSRNTEALLQTDQLTRDKIAEIQSSSPLGRILAAGLVNLDQSTAAIRDAIEEAGRHAVHDLERYLNALGTIASITPLLGLLGTVIGMIKVFAAITAVGVGNPQALAGGISEALITTAAGLSVGIPSLLFSRYFRGRVRELTVEMEQQALRMLDVIRRLQSG
ncbi:MAG: MotA/TolQ/ExbB proton channel family protein [Pseudomonadota bacterium]|nr:MotA/TolQ/ExbB proton channel family protein [Pseudomonadota bacterium]